MSDLELAELVAQYTAERLKESFSEELGSFRDQWAKDLAKLRDDLTVKGLLNSEACGLDCPVREQLLTEVKGAQVLIVDDYKQVRTVLARLLQEAGISTFEAEDGKGAAAILASETGIDVVVADIAMPNNGYTLLEHVREHYPTIEVVMVSGYDTEAGKARDMGAFAFLAKPFTAAQAVLIIERAVEARRHKSSPLHSFPTPVPTK